MEDIVLVLMVKDEIDIIMENLVWHFCVGFRKVIIVDNQSSEGTRERINEFARFTKDIATVFIIDDPIVEHIQTRNKLSKILSQIPDKYGALTVLSTRYFANNDYYNYPETIPLYEKK